MNKKWITLVGIVIAVLAVLFLAWNYLGNRIIQRPEFTQNAPDLVSSSPDKLSGDSRIFNDKDAINPFKDSNAQNFGYPGIEFKYPKDFIRTLGGSPYNSEYGIISFKNPSDSTGIGGIEFWIFSNQSSLDGFISRVIKNTEFTSSDETVGGVPAKRLSLKSQLVADSNQIFFVKDGFGFRWIANKTRDIDGGQNMIPTLNSILSTFKFTK